MPKNTIDEMLAMEPGSELNRLVATKVMGYRIYHYSKDIEERCYYMLVTEEYDPVAEYVGLRTGERKTEEEAWSDCPDFSGDIAKAWEVVEKLRKDEFIYHISTSVAPNQHAVNFIDIDGSARHSGIIHSENAPEAICKAALLAVMCPKCKR